MCSPNKHKVMNKIYFLLIFLFVTQYCFSQKITWENSHDTLPNFKNVLTKKNGNYLILGNNYLSKKLDPPLITKHGTTYYENLCKYEILRLDKKNNLTRKISTTFENNERGRILIDSKKDDFILIKSQRIRNGEKNITKYFAQKFNKSFEEEWIKEISLGNSYRDLKEGVSHKNAEYTLLFSGESEEIIHFDSEGNKVWSTSIEDSLINLKSILPTSTNEFILVGEKSIYSNGCFVHSDYFVLKLDQNGNQIWSNTYREQKESIAKKVVEMPNGDFVIGGYAYCNKDKYKHVDGVLDRSGSKEVGIFKIDNDGTLIWDKSYGGFGSDSFTDISLTKDGRIMILAFTYSRDGDIYKSNGSSDLWIVQLNSNGDLIWEETYGDIKGDRGSILAPSSDQDDFFTVFGVKQYGQGPIHWMFKIDDSFDISKPETHSIERKNSIKEIEEK